MQAYEGSEGKDIPHAGTQKKTKWSTSVDNLGEQISEVDISAGGGGVQRRDKSELPDRLDGSSLAKEWEKEEKEKGKGKGNTGYNHDDPGGTLYLVRFHAVESNQTLSPGAAQWDEQGQPYDDLK